MNHFWKHLCSCFIWLIMSELLCLVLAFSFAILSATWIRWMSMACGILAHVLLMFTCAKKIAADDTAFYRRERKRIGQLKPLLLSIAIAIPAWISYIVLALHPQSILALNLFPLLNSPYLQLHRLFIGGVEPFSAISTLGKILMIFPPLISAVSWWIGYQTAYITAVAEIDSSKSRT